MGALIPIILVVELSQGLVDRQISCLLAPDFSTRDRNDVVVPELIVPSLQRPDHFLAHPSVRQAAQDRQKDHFVRCLQVDLEWADRVVDRNAWSVGQWFSAWPCEQVIQTATEISGSRLV